MFSGLLLNVVVIRGEVCHECAMALSSGILAPRSDSFRDRVGGRSKNAQEAPEHALGDVLSE